MFGNMDYNIIFQTAVKSALESVKNIPGVCTTVLHVYTSNCWLTTAPFNIAPYGQPANYMQAILPCGENCCENLFDLTTNPPTHISTSVKGNGIDNCITLISGTRQNNVCYTVPCEAFLPSTKLFKKIISNSN